MSGMRKRLVSMATALLMMCTLLTMLPQGRVSAAESYLWPVPSSTSMSRGYSGSHDGLDITGSLNAPVLATKSGTVVAVINGDVEGKWYDYGKGVVLRHDDDGKYSHYAHLNFTSVSVNQHVSQGQQLGGMGATGKATGVHLHFAVATSMYGEGGRIDVNPGTINYIYKAGANDPLTTPTITTNKSAYVVGETVNVSWAASSSNSNLSHYWLNVDGPDGKAVYNLNMGKNTSYSFKVTQVGTYTLTAFATPMGSQSGEGSLSDRKTITVKYADPMTVPVIHTDKTMYAAGEKATISWEKTSASSDFYQYWLIVRNTDTSTEVYGGDAGSTGNVNKNYYELTLPTKGTYKITVFAVPYTDKETNQRCATTTINVVDKSDLKEMTVPVITTDKKYYSVGEVAHITWEKSPSDSDFYSYRIFILWTSKVEQPYRIYEISESVNNPDYNHYDLYLPCDGICTVQIEADPVVDTDKRSKAYIYEFCVGDYVDLGDDFYANIVLDSNGLPVIESADSNVQLGSKSDINENNAKWHFIKNPRRYLENSYIISNASSGKLLDTSYYDDSVGRSVKTSPEYDEQNPGNNIWYVIKRPDGSYNIECNYWGRDLTVSAANAAVNSDVTVTERDVNSSSQKFSIIKLTTTLKGDINNDGKLDSKDAMLAVAYAKKTAQPKDDRQFGAADVNGDGKIDSRDALMIINAVKTKKSL